MNIRLLSILLVAALLAACTKGSNNGVRVVSGGGSPSGTQQPEAIRNFTSAEIYAAIVGKTFQYTRSDGNGTRPVWCDLGGRPGPDDGGLTAIPFPLNFAYPQPVRLHPDKPYFSFAPAAVGEFSIEPGKPFVSAYRFHAHAGKVDAAGTELLARDLTDPPSIRFVPYPVGK